MKNKFLLFAAFTAALCFPKINFGQAPTLGSTANYALFSTNGSLANTGTSTFTGDIGSNNGTCTNFTSVNGVVHIMDASTALCASDLLTLYNQLNNTAATLIPVATLGNNQVITPGAYSITTAATLNGTLTLDAQSNSNAVFIIQIFGAFGTNAGSVVNLINGAVPCNVFWQIEGAITMAAGTLMKGTMIANNALIDIGAGCVLNGRAMSTTGAVAVNGSTVFISTCSNPSPSITTQPVNQSACSGSSVSYSVVAIGAGLTYQWRTGTTNLVNGGSISGATSAVLTINPATSANVASNYNVVVSGTYSPSVTSSNVSFSIINAPVITTAPSSQTVCLGSAVNFPITVSGSGLSYQWRKGTTNLVNGGSISGVTSANLIINPTALIDVASNYNVVVSGSCSASQTSGNISLTLNNSPSITAQPGSQTLCAGSSMNFSVSASGTGLTYQWRKGTVNLSNGGTISGATSAVLTITGLISTDAATDYNVVVTGLCSPSANSFNTTLVVNTAPIITTQPASQSVCLGLNANISVVSSGSGLSYQWRKGTVNINNGGTISGATSSQLVITGVASTDAASNYNVIITGLCAPSVTSTNMALTITTAPVLLAQPVSQTICANSPVNFIATTSGSGLTYQWRKGLVNITNGGTTSGATNSVLTIAAVTSSDIANNYNVLITGVCAPAITSTNVSLGVNFVPTIIAQPLSQTVCVGGTVSLDVLATGTNLNYQWRNGTTLLNNGNNISGANSPILTFNPAYLSNASNNYNVVVSGHCLPDQISINVSLTIGTSPIIAMIAGTQEVCVGTSVNFPVNVSGAGLTFQWRKGSTNLTNGGTVSGVNTATLNINPVSVSDAGTDYNLVITGQCAPSKTTANMTLIVNTSAAIVLQPNNQMAYMGGSASFSVVASGSGLTYQWRRGTINLVNGANISGVKSPVLTINPVFAMDTAGNYNVVISGPCSQDIVSNNAILWVCYCPQPTALREEAAALGTVNVYPNPFSNTLNVIVDKESIMNTCEIFIYSISGTEVMRSTVTKELTVIDTNEFASGAYFYRIVIGDKVIQSGKLIAQH